MTHALGRLKQLILLVGDVALGFVSLYTTLAIRAGYPLLPGVWEDHVTPFTIIFVSWGVIFFINGLYDLTRARNNFAFYRTFAASLGIAVLLAVGFFYLFPFFGITPRANLALTVVIYGALFLIWRTLMHTLLRSSAVRRRVLLVGTQGEAFELIDALRASPQIGYEVIGIFDPQSSGGERDGIVWLARIEELKPFIRTRHVSTVVIAVNHGERELLARELYDTIFWQVEILDIAHFFELILGRVPVTSISEMWFLENLKETKKRLYDATHLLIDYVAAFVLGALTAALFPVVAFAIVIEDRGPALYAQERVGKGGKIFKIYKFRTMRADAERGGAQFAKLHDTRVTVVGNFLRKTRLDELPQVWNILTGEMCFIGPRPERPEFVEHFADVIPFYHARHLVKPGLTGWAQISHPYYATMSEHVRKLQYDLFYIKNRSFILDLKIILKTIGTILRWAGR